MDKLAQVPIGEKFKSPFGQEYNLGDLVSVVLTNALVIAGVILLFFLIIGGFSLVIGAGQDDPERAGKGRQTATSAAIGFIIIFAAYWIIQIVEVLTGIQILNPVFN